MTLIPGGFIQTPRAVFKDGSTHWLAKYWRRRRKFSHYEALHELTERAAFATYERDANGQTVTIPRGHVVASIRLCAARWRWSTTAVHRLFARLESDGEVYTVTVTPIGTLYRLTYYEDDQGDGTGSVTPSGTEAEQGRNNSKKESSQEHAAAGVGRPDIIPFSPVVDLGYINRCVDSLNAAMETNPQVRGFHVILALNQLDAVRWDRDGIPLDLALAVIQERAASYRPTGRNKQISSLAYFDGAVRDRWGSLQGARGQFTVSNGAQTPTLREAILAKRGF